MSDAFQVEGFNEQVKQLQKIMTDDPMFRRRVQAAIKTVFREVRKAVSQDASQILVNDPRKAYKAIRTSVYRRILGGQVNILQKRKAGAPGNYQKPKKGLPKKGGNRWGRSERTKSLEGYEGTDRGFILRFINAGTETRYIHSYTDKHGNRHDLKSGDGNRKKLDGNNWFRNSSQQYLEGVADQLQDLIDRIINDQFR